MATAANTNPYAVKYASEIAQRIAAQLATAGSNATITTAESNEGVASGTFETTSTVQSFQTALDQYSLTKADASNGQLTNPTLTNPTLIGNTFATTPTRGATDNEIATAEFVAQAITDTLTGLGSIVPVGTIAMWSGTLEMTPAGWHVCDGTNGTPDLRGRFVLGANSTITASSTGGSATTTLDANNIPSHTHSFSGTTGTESASHTHSITATDSGHSHGGIRTPSGTIYNGAGSAPNMVGTGSTAVGYASISASAGTQSANHTHDVSGTTGSYGSGTSFSNMPPYYALYYIMKLADVATPPATTPLYADTTNGRVGVNVANPTVTLDVLGATKLTGTVASGNTTITGFATVSTTLQVSGNTQLASLGIGTAASGTAGEIRATNNITAYYSDDRFKTRLGNIENALDKIDQLSGFYYEANELAQSYGYEKIREVGVSAQDTQKVMNEIVAPAPVDDRYLTVRYEKFAPLLIEGIKELRVELNKIKTHLNI